MLLELSCKLPKVNGYFIFLKGNIEEELKESENAQKLLHIKLIQKEEFLLPIENSKRTIIKLQKTEEINNKYPRNFTQIKQKPL